MKRMILITVFVAIFYMSAGCSDRAPDMPELGSVHGTVTLDGKPLSGVSLYFEPEKGRTSMAKANAEGIYEAVYLLDENGVKLGPCNARVEWGIDESGPAIPPQYGTKSKLKLDVKPGDNTFDIDMKSK